MNPRLTETTLIKIKCSDITSSLPSSMIQLKKSVNPEATTLKANKSDISKYSECDQSINSPFQRDKFLYNYSHKPVSRSSIHKRSYANDNLYEVNRKMTEMKHPQVIKMGEMEGGKDPLSKSWTYQSDHREIMTFLEQIIAEMSDKNDYDLAKRYISKVTSTFLNAKLLRVVEKLEEKGREKYPSEAIQFRDQLIEFLKKHFKYERSIQLASTDRLFKQLQKSLTKLRDSNIRSPRKQSLERVRELKQQSKHMNAKLEKQTRELQKTLQQERGKMKQSYEQIYRKIYEENSRLRREIQAREKQFVKQKEENALIKSKYESIFVQVSNEFKEIKLEYNKLINQSSAEAKKSRHLLEQFNFASERLALEENKNRELEIQLEKNQQKARFLQIDKANLQSLCDKYKNYAEKFLSQNKVYQSEKEKSMIDNQRQVFDNKEKEKIVGILQVKIQENESILSKQIEQMNANAVLLEQSLKKYEQATKNTELLIQQQRQQKIQLGKLQQQLSSIIQRKSKQEQSLTLVIKTKENLKSSLNILQNTLRQNEQNQRSANKKMEDLNKITVTKEQHLRILNNQINQLSQRLNRLRQEEQTTRKSLCKLSEQLSSLNSQIQRTRQGIKEQHQKKLLNQTQLQAINNEIMEKKQRLYELNFSIIDKEKQAESISTSISRSKNDINLMKIEMVKSKQILQKQRNTIASEIIKMKQQISHLLTEKQEIMRENSAMLSSQKKDTESYLINLQSASLQALRKQKSQEQKRLSVVMHQLEEKINQNRHLVEEIQNQQSLLSSIHKAIKEANSQYTDLSSSILSTQKQIAVNNEHLQCINRSITQKSAELESLNRKKINLLPELDKMGQDLCELRCSISSAKLESEQIHQQLEAGLGRLRGVQLQIESKVRIYEELEQSLRSSISLHESSKTASTSAERSAIDAQIGTMRAELQTLRSSVDRTRSEKTMIESQLHARERELAKIKYQIEIKYEQLVCLQGDILIKTQSYNTLNRNQ